MITVCVHASLRWENHFFLNENSICSAKMLWFEKVAILQKSRPISSPHASDVSSANYVCSKIEVCTFNVSLNNKLPIITGFRHSDFRGKWLSCTLGDRMLRRPARLKCMKSILRRGNTYLIPIQLAASQRPL